MFASRFFSNTSDTLNFFFRLRSIPRVFHFLTFPLFFSSCRSFQSVSKFPFVFDLISRSRYINFFDVLVRRLSVVSFVPFRRRSKRNIHSVFNPFCIRNESSLQLDYFLYTFKMSLFCKN